MASATGVAIDERKHDCVRLHPSSLPFILYQLPIPCSTLLRFGSVHQPNEVMIS